MVVFNKKFYKSRWHSYFWFVFSMSCVVAPGFTAELPSGGQVVHGNTQIVNANPNHLQIRQSSQNTIINWNTFSIGPGNGRAGMLNLYGDELATFDGDFSLITIGRWLVYVYDPSVTNEGGLSDTRQYFKAYDTAPSFSESGFVYVLGSKVEPTQISCETTGNCPVDPALPMVVCIPDEEQGIDCDWADGGVNAGVPASTVPVGVHKELEQDGKKVTSMPGGNESWM